LPKILVGRFALPVVRVMLLECGLNEVLALPEKVNLAEFQRVAESNLRDDDEKLDIHPCTALSALLNSTEDVKRFRQRVTMSNADLSLCEFIVTMREKAMLAGRTEQEALKLYKFYVLDKVYQRGVDISETAFNHCEEMLKYVDAPETLRQQFHEWRDGGIEVFPVSGRDLLDAGVPSRKIIKRELDRLYDRWKEGDLSASKEELLGNVPDLVDLLEEMGAE